ncbi:MAG: hypothetical protein ACJAYK_001420 [Crocinitomicaceae bacterium]|jgi:hypothetical protein
MLDCISYTQTPGGQMLLVDASGQVNKNHHYDVLGVVAQSIPGVFEVKYKGAKVLIGCSLLLPVKGAKNTSLKMKVEKVDPLITPIGSWSAVCIGPEYKEFDLKNIEASCDTCGQSYQLEFIAYSDNLQQDALEAMKMQSWKATSDKQVCPSCPDETSSEKR